MNIKEISEKLGLSFLNEAEPSKEVEGGYCGDLLSFVMSHAKCGDCWFTVMGNVNAVAVAVLSDCAADSENASSAEERMLTPCSLAFSSASPSSVEFSHRTIAAQSDSTATATAC